MENVNNQSDNLFRMEKSVLSKKNLDELYQVAGDRVAESLLQYICYEHQYNIFGYGYLDPSDFERRFNYSRQYLAEKSIAPYQRQIKPIGRKEDKSLDLRRRILPEHPKDVLYENRLENALFVLENYPLGVTCTIVQTDKQLIRTFRSIRVLKEFSIIQDHETGKVTYRYLLEEDFRRNLDTLYLNVNINSLVALRKSNLSPLYFTLVKLRNALYADKRTETTPENTPQFSYLCSLANINEKQELKYRKRDLNRVFDKLNRETELDFSVIWTADQNKQKYLPIFRFNPTDSEKAQFDNEHIKKIQRLDERIIIAVNELKYNLIAACPMDRKQYGDDAEEYFFNWIKNANRLTLSEIDTCFSRTFINIGCEVPQDIRERIDLFHHNIQYRKPQELDSWLPELFAGRFRLTPKTIIKSQSELLSKMED